MADFPIFNPGDIVRSTARAGAYPGCYCITEMEEESNGKIFRIVGANEPKDRYQFVWIEAVDKRDKLRASRACTWTSAMFELVERDVTKNFTMTFDDLWGSRNENC